MRCNDCKNKLALYVDNELGAEEKNLIESHLLKCPLCAKELKNLESLNSIGKIKISVEPPPEYWGQLTRSIMKNIPKPRKRTFRINGILDNLQSIRWHGKISYRLAGLVTTAVIIFFIIRIGFNNQRKFILPVEIDVEDAVKRTEKQELYLKPELKVASTKKPTQQLGEVHSPISDSKTSQKSIAMNNPKQRAMKPDQPGIESGDISILADDDIITPRGKSISKAPTPRSEAKQSNMKKMRNFSIQPTAVNLDEEKSEKNPALVEYSQDLLGVMKRHEVDSSNFKFNEAMIYSIKEVQFLEKLKIWEKYIQTETNFNHIKAAKYQQALLYYNLAKKTNKKEDIQQALNFYFQNRDLLFSGANPDSVKKEVDELEALLKKSEKTDK